jgi:hypothetical protein
MVVVQRWRIQMGGGRGISERVDKKKRGRGESFDDGDLFCGVQGNHDVVPAIRVTFAT